MTDSERAQLRKDLKDAGFIQVCSGGTQAGKTTEAHKSGMRYYTGFENGQRRIFGEYVAEFEAVP